MTKDTSEESEKGPAGSAAVEDVLSLLSTYISKEGIKKLREIDVQSEALLAANAELEAANRVNNTTIARLTRDWDNERESLGHENRAQEDRYNALLHEKSVADESIIMQQSVTAELQNRLDDQNELLQTQTAAVEQNNHRIMMLEAQINNLQEDLTKSTTRASKLENDLNSAKEQKEELSRQLRTVNGSLATVQQFLVELKELSRQKSQIREALADLFNHALAFFQAAFDQDLSVETLRQSSLNEFSIPLPASNSAAARQMRVAVGLVACGKAFEKHIFRQSFLIQSSEMDDILCNLAATNPLQETYLRGVLPKVSPEKQQKNRALGLSLAVEEISKYVRDWANNKQAFDAGLSHLCEKACTSWMLVLQVEDRISPSFAFDAPEDWMQLPMVSKTSQKKHQQKGQKRNDQAQGRTVEAAEVGRTIWPTFLAADPRDPAGSDSTALEVVHHGYVLTKAQMQEAADELAKVEMSHRVARRVSRRVEPDQRQRRNSSVFLNGGLGSSDAK